MIGQRIAHFRNSAIENGRMNPGVLTLKKLADALDISLEKLIPRRSESHEQGEEDSHDSTCQDPL